MLQLFIVSHIAALLSFISALNESHCFSFGLFFFFLNVAFLLVLECHSIHFAVFYEAEKTLIYFELFVTMSVPETA